MPKSGTAHNFCVSKYHPTSNLDIKFADTKQSQTKEIEFADTKQSQTEEIADIKQSQTEEI